jgi:hypothetical protein
LPTWRWSFVTSSIRHWNVAAEQVQLGLARLAAAPRRDAGLDGRPVGHDELLALGGDQRRTQHGLEHVGHALAELRHDAVPAHHGLPD